MGPVNAGAIFLYINTPRGEDPTNFAGGGSIRGTGRLQDSRHKSRIKLKVSNMSVPCCAEAGIPVEAPELRTLLLLGPRITTKVMSPCYERCYLVERH